MTGRYRADWIRTSDLLNPIQALYQAEPQPELTTYLPVRRISPPRLEHGIYYASSGFSRNTFSPTDRV